MLRLFKAEILQNSHYNLWVEIKTQRLLLREYELSDFERVHIYGSNPDFSKYEPWGPNSVEDTHIYIEDMMALANVPDRSKFEMAVTLDGILIGGCGIRRESQNSSVAALGWAINPEFQNQGYATEAAKALIEFGFNQLNLSVIYATCDSRNTASYKVMEKAGMQRVGLLISNREIKGHVRDSLRYEIHKK
jgi:[ribosomal protein S5]-alanine N-acetyltransferase